MKIVSDIKQIKDNYYQVYFDDGSVESFTFLERHLVGNKIGLVKTSNLEKGDMIISSKY